MAISRRALLLTGLTAGSLGALSLAGAAEGLFSPTARSDQDPLKRVEPQPPLTDTSQIWGFGSSTMALLGPHLVPTFSDATFHPQGKGGERAQHIFARMGSTPAIISVPGHELPASGSVQVKAWNMPASASLKAYPGTLAGIPGVLSSTASKVFFTRSRPGIAHTVPERTPFLPMNAKTIRHSMVLINAGKNNLRDPGDVVGLVNSLTNHASQWMAPRKKNCVVMNHFVNSNQSPGSRQYKNVQDVNQNILSTYGQTAFDLNAYVLSTEIWEESGIRPSGSDVRQQAIGVKPDGLSRDVGHLNEAANAAVAARIRQHFIDLGYYPETRH